METYKRAWETRDDALLCSLFAPDGVYHNTPFDQQAGHEAIARYWDRVKLQDEYVGHRGLPVYMVMRPASREVRGMFELPSTGAQDDKLLAFLEAQRDAEREHGAP